MSLFVNRPTKEKKFVSTEPDAELRYKTRLYESVDKKKGEKLCRKT